MECRFPKEPGFRSVSVRFNSSASFVPRQSEEEQEEEVAYTAETAELLWS